MLSLFEIVEARDKLYRNLDISNKTNLTSQVIEDPIQDLGKLNVEKENDLLSLKIISDRQYELDQYIYIAEGYVNVIINGGI